MTRNEFLENINEWWELKDFCSEYGCDILDDVYDDEGRDDYIDECLVDWAREDNWRDLLNRLDSIPTGYDWYRYNGYGEWDGLDDEDFASYKGDVLDWADENDLWDAEEDEEEEEDEELFEEEEDEPTPDEDFSVGDLIGMCVITLGTIQDENARRAREEEEEFRRLYPKVLK